MRALASFSLVVLLSALATGGHLAAHATAISTDKTQVDTSSVEGERATLQQAFTKLQNKDLEGAATLLDQVIEAHAFAGLDAELQHAALSVAGLVALQLEQSRQAHAYLVRATEMKEATGDDWFGRLQAAYALNDMTDASLSLLNIAEGWPPTLMEIRDRAVFRLVHELGRAAGKEEQHYALLDALFEAGWRAEDEQEPSTLWRDLTLLLIERNDVERASQVAERITDPYVLIGMRADNRFASVIKANPLHKDIGRAATQQLDELRAAVERSPRQLERITGLGLALLNNVRNDDAFKLMDDTLTRVTSAPKDAPFDDVEEQLVWVMDYRARALCRLGRWDDAVEQWERARKQSEEEGENVSQAINLGDLYTRLDRPKDALKAIAKVERVSPYGRMQLEGVRLAAAVELQDQKEIKRALGYLREHQADAADTYQWALVQVGDLDDASAVLRARLADPKERFTALLSVQQYTEPQRTPREVEWYGRWKVLLARPDVQAAINAVGNSQQYDLAEAPG